MQNCVVISSETICPSVEKEKKEAVQWDLLVACSLLFYIVNESSADKVYREVTTSTGDSTETIVIDFQKKDVSSSKVRTMLLDDENTSALNLNFIFNNAEGKT